MKTIIAHNCQDEESLEMYGVGFSAKIFISGKIFDVR